MRSILNIIKLYPIRCLILIGTLYLYWPQGIQKVYFDGNEARVSRGLSYRARSEFDLEVYPYMIQSRFLGLPQEAGVSQSLYFVTRKDLEQAKAEYNENGGCWPSTFSSFKREFLAVGDPKNISKHIIHEGPPSLHDKPQFIRIKGHRLTPTKNDESARHASQVAAMRDAEFVLMQSVWKTG